MCIRDSFEDDLAVLKLAAAEEVAHQRAEFARDADDYLVRGDAFRTWYAGKLTDFKRDEQVDIAGSPGLESPLSPLAYRTPSPPGRDGTALFISRAGTGVDFLFRGPAGSGTGLDFLFRRRDWIFRAPAGKR